MYVSEEFNYRGLKDNQFREHELAEFLTGTPHKNGATLTGFAFDVTGKDSERYTAKLEKSEDGKTITLDAMLRRETFTYKTTMTAVRVAPNIYEVTELTFDNHKEKLDRRWEMSKVLGHIGSEQLKKGVDGKLADPHKEKGKFGKIARFFDRLIPNDPNDIAVPPMF